MQKVNTIKTYNEQQWKTWLNEDRKSFFSQKSSKSSKKKFILNIFTVSQFTVGDKNVSFV